MGPTVNTYQSYGLHLFGDFFGGSVDASEEFAVDYWGFLYKLPAVQIAAAGKLVQVATTLMAVQLLFVRAHQVPPRLFGDLD